MKVIASSGLLLLSLSSLTFSQPVFGVPVDLGPKINSPHYEGDPFLTADGKKLFFVGGEGRKYSYGKEDIWFCEWTDTGWAEAQILGPQINNSGRQMSPSVSPDGQKLYYVDDSLNGKYWDIWVSTWDSSLNDWGTPQNLGYPVNTKGTEKSAKISPDGRQLYFTSTSGADSLFWLGRCGIYMSEWDGQKWSVPRLQWGCGVPEFPSVTANNRWLFFQDRVPWFDNYRASSIFVTGRKGTGWISPAVDLQQEIDIWVWSPFITPSGDSLFFSSGLFGRDIMLAKRLPPGDLNMDGQLTIVDVQFEVNRVFIGEPYPAPGRLGDSNCDSLFTAVDIIILLNQIFLQKPSPCH